MRCELVTLLRGAAPLFALCATGCLPALGPAYVPSADSDAAHIVFVSKSGGTNMGILALSGPMQGCICSSSRPEIVGIIHNYSALVSGSGSYADRGKNVDQFSVDIPPREEFRFMMPSASYQADVGGPIWKVKTSFCQPHESFIPEARANYEVVYDASVDMCSFGVYKVVENQRIPISTKKYPLCLQPQLATSTDALSRGIRESCERGMAGQKE